MGESGFAAPPDPGLAGALDELVERLRLLKVWAGNPSYERITERINVAWSEAGRPPHELARKTTVVDCFRPGRRRLNTDLVLAVVQALHPEVGYVAQWRQALRVIGGETQAAAHIRVQDALPQDLPEFTGRNLELAQLLQHARDDGTAMVISAIEGMAGIGKTQLAVHTGHRLIRENAVDRVLFVNLRGFHPDPAQPPADPAAVLDGFLRVLGLPGQQIPHDLDARTAAYRDALAGSRTLVVLDNAADTEQVRPLLPATPGCLALVTSRRALTELHPAIQLTVDVFTADEAVAFLTRAAPDVPVGMDPHAADRIAQRCGHLPLALALVAGHIRSTPGWTLTDHADRLDERHHHRRLDTGVELALNLSYQRLPAEQQQLLRLSALHPGQDFDVYAAAALTDTDLPAAQRHLDHLCRDHLLQWAISGRFLLHDVVRDYAVNRATDEDRPPQRRAALTRLLDYYVATAAAAMDVAYPHEREGRTVPPTATPTPVLADQKQADRWLDAELANLLAAAHHAAEHGWPEHTWQLSSTLDRHLRTRGRYPDAQTLHERALHLARDLGSRAAEADALVGLGYVERRLGRYAQAGEHYKRALQIAHDVGDRAGVLKALHGLGTVCVMLGRHEEAGEHFERELQIAQTIGHRSGELQALNGLADVHLMLGRYEQAGDRYEQGLQIAAGIGNRGGELYSLAGLGHVHRMLGRYEQAVGHLERALQIAQTTGHRSGELQALNGLGHVNRMLGRYEQAADSHEQILDLARELGSSNWQYEALQGLGRLHHATGRSDLALTHHEQALRLATDLAQPEDQARAYDGLAHAHRAVGDHDQARLHWRLALDILTAHGTDRTEDIETSVPNIRAHLTDLDG